MSFGPPELIRHILDEIDFVIDRSAGLDECAFMRDPTVQRAFIRSLEIIGEAVKKLPPDFRAAHGDIPWKRMAGLRDRLIHDYFGVDLAIVWEVTSEHLPSLRDGLAAILTERD